MKFSRDDRKQNLTFDLTPFVDVVFQLLIFFMVTTTFVVSSAIDIDLPKAKGEAAETSKNVRISINNEGLIHVNGTFYNDLNVADVLAGIKEKTPSAVVVIEADKAATHGKVVFVMDTARKTGFEKFAIAVEEE